MPRAALARSVLALGLWSSVLATGTAWADDPLVAPVPSPAPPAAGDPSLDHHVLEPFVVLGRSADAYVSDQPTAASRLDLEILDTPKAVQVVPRAVIDDQQAIVPGEITRNVSGVQQWATAFGSDEAFIIRGFLQQNAYKDGIRGVPLDGFGDQPASTDVANLERVEVIKGPASILFGRVEPGGIVNYVTKRPRTTEAYSIRQRFGSYDFYRTEADATGPIGDGDVAYRAIGAYQRSGGFVDFTSGERAFFSGGLLWQPDADTEVRFRLDYLHDDQLPGVGLPIVDGAFLPGVPYDRFLGEPTVNRRRSDVLETFVEADHRVSDALQLTLRAAYQPSWVHTADLEIGTYLNPLYWDPETMTLGRTLYDGRFDTYNATVQGWAITSYGLGDLAADADGTWSWLHDVSGQLVAGLEWETRNAQGERLIADASRIDPFHPVYTGWVIDPIRQTTETSDYDIEEVSLALENKLGWRDDRVVLLAGVRVGYSELRSTWIYRPILYPDLKGSAYDTPVIPFVGLLGRPLPSLSVYGSYSESFQPTRIPRETKSGDPLEPETGQQWEGGVKYEALDGRLLATASGFRITKQNVVSPDPFNPGFPKNIGEQESKGAELDVAGTILPGWRLIASYAYVDARITDDPSGDTTGNRLFGVPQNSGSVWTTYVFESGTLAGLAGGIGVFVTGDVANDDANSLELPSWTQLDGMLAYTRGPFQVQLNLKNMTDQKAFLAQGNVYRAVPVPPLTVLGSIAWRY